MAFAVINSFRNTLGSFREPFHNTPTCLRYTHHFHYLYRPNTSSAYSSKTSVFLDEFCFLLSIDVSTLKGFVFTHDLKFHVGTSSYTLASYSLNLLSSINLVQHVNFQSHTKSQALVLFITSTAYLLSHELSHSVLNINDHYLIIT